MGRLLLLRHAQSVWNAAGRWQGWSDAPLSELGERQAVQAGAALAAAGKTPWVMASSDLSRARRTAELIAGETAYRGALSVDPALREQDLGYWNGLTNIDIAARWPAQLDARRAGLLEDVPGGEKGAVFSARCLGALARLAGLVPGNDDEAVVVAHGGVLVAVERALGVWRDDNRHGNLSGWWLEAQGAGPGLELLPRRPVDLLARATETVTGPA